MNLMFGKSRSCTFRYRDIVVSSVFLQHPAARSRMQVEALPESGFRYGIHLISRELEMPRMIELIAGFARKAAENREG